MGRLANFGAKGALLASKPFAFSRASRLLSAEQYATALRAKPFARSGSFTFHWCKCDSSDPLDCDRAKLGFVIPKRLVQLSVRRNAIKRVLRESFRCRQDALPPGYYVIRLKAPLHAGSLTQLKRDVRQQAEQLLSKAGMKT